MSSKSAGKECARVFVVVGLVLAVSHLAHGQEWPGPRFHDFSGTCHGYSTGELWDHALSWDRKDFIWEWYERVEGQYDTAFLQAFGDDIVTYRARDCYVLPILDYNTQWSSEGTDIHDPLAAEHVVDWENYVRSVVSFLKEPPYDVEYFQIWNEAHPCSGFWNGDLDTYMERVHLPAAEIIHELGCKVVYGGFPMCGSITEYIALLDTHNAWSSVDVLSAHYVGVNAFDTLYHAAVDRGYPDMGIWLTEVGYSPYTSWIGDAYPEFLKWALTHDWSYPHRYKVFYYAYRGANESQWQRSLYWDGTLWEHGRCLLTLGELLDGNGLRVYSSFSIEPEVSGTCFAVDNRIVLALTDSSEAITVRFPDTAWAEVKDVQKVGYYGEITDLTSAAAYSPEGGISVDVPGSTTGKFYVVVHLYQGTDIFSKFPKGGWAEADDTWTFEAGLVRPYGAAQYVWMRNGEPIMDAPSQPVYTLDPLTTDDGGWYSCRITDEGGADFTTEPVLLEVFEAGSLPLNTWAGLTLLCGLVAISGVVFLRRSKTTV